MPFYSDPDFSHHPTLTARLGQGKPAVHHNNLCVTEDQLTITRSTLQDKPP